MQLLSPGWAVSISLKPVGLSALSIMTLVVVDDPL
jgi:hypothetical protein